MSSRPVAGDGRAATKALSSEQYCYLTTVGRVTGRQHEIEIWFGMPDGGSNIYLLSGGRERSDWVKNLTKEPAVTVRIGERRFRGTARRVISGTAEDAEARRLLVGKYRTSNDDLSAWGRTALPIAIALREEGDSEGT